nr:unnamed protein product [Digitaria exilis]
MVFFFSISTSKIYAMHRLDVSKHLFHPSTVEAEQAHSKDEKETNNGGKPKPLRIERLRRLPAPIAGFESSDWCPTTLNMFVLLNGGHGEPGGRILHANNHGQTALYDTESRTVVCVSDLGMPKGPKPMTFVIPGAGTGEENLYVLRSIYDTNYQCSQNFEVLSAMNHRCSINFKNIGYSSDDEFGGDLVDFRTNLKWYPLPPPPFSTGDILVSSTELDRSQTICVSSMYKGTFCFDTETRQWWHAGDWKLPFYGRGEYVPELEPG